MLYKFLRLIAIIYTSIFFPTKVINKSNFIGGKSVVICNHYSSMDSILLGSKLFKNDLNCLGKQEAFDNVKIVGKMFIKCGGIPVDRDAPGLTTHRKLLSVLKENKTLLIFPEGTRNASGDSQLAPLHEGAGVYATRCNAPLVPVMFYTKPTRYKKNYLIIGKPYSFDYLNGKSNKEIKEEVVQVMVQKFAELRHEINEYVENKNKKRK